jgi:RNA polymerase sigma-70 factor (ECF subfamily)
MPASPDASSATFVTTHWTRVLQARGDSPDAKAALSELCAAYYAPVFVFIRHHAGDEDSARDLTQEFFARLLVRQGIDTVDPQRGRFRSFLLGAVKHFLADVHDHSARLKRGRGQPPISLDQGTTDTKGPMQVAAAQLQPDDEFDYKWALTVLENAIQTLSGEFSEAGKTKDFDVLKPWLTGDSDTLPQSEAAATLGMSEGALKVAIHRTRRRFRELVKAQIASTLSDPSQVHEELSCLLAALSRRT